jgi:hypothetical protein
MCKRDGANVLDEERVSRAQTRRAMRPFLVVGLFAGAVLGMPSTGVSQEIGVYHVSASSDLSEIASADGVGLYGRVFPSSWLSIRGALYRQTETAGRRGIVCTQYVPEVGCGEEEVRTDTRLRGFAATAAARHRPLSFLELEAGAGLSLNQVLADERTESGRRSSLYQLRSNQAGWLVLGSVRVRPVEALPLTLEAGATHHRLLLRGCAADHDLQYDPFCGSADLREVRLGVGYDLGW